MSDAGVNGPSDYSPTGGKKKNPISIGAKLTIGGATTRPSTGTNKASFKTKVIS